MSDDDLEREEFVKRCQLLVTMLDSLVSLEPSTRVWISSLCTVIKGIIQEQENPKAALNQVIDMLSSPEK